MKPEELLAAMKEFKAAHPEAEESQILTMFFISELQSLTRELNCMRMKNGG